MSRRFEPTHNGCGNSILRFDDFFVSYNPNPGWPYSIFASDTGGAETALVVNGKYYVLNGDFRKDFLTLGEQGLEACMDFYNEHSDAKSSWSEDT